MILLALDPATRCGYAVLWSLGDEATLVDSGVLELGAHGDHGHRFAAFADQLASLLSRHEPGELVCETVLLSTGKGKGARFGHQAKEFQLGLLAIARMTAARRRISYRTFHPSTVKKSIAGDGRADKRDVIAALRRRFGGALDRHLDDNEADAIAIGLHALEAG